MRITTKISATTDHALTRLPLPLYKMEQCIDPKTQKLDVVKAQLAFAGIAVDGTSPFTLSSRDDSLVYWTAMTFCEEMEDAFKIVTDDTSNDCHVAAETKTDHQLERKMDRGKFAYSRMDINRVADGVSVKVGYSNPLGTVGGSESEARGYAVACTQLWLRIIPHITNFAVRLDVADDILAEAKERNRLCELRRKRASCARNICGYCSPSDGSCPLYKDGRCQEVA